MSQTSNLFNKNCPINCCKDCNNRQIGCHSTCQLYNEQRKARDEMKDDLINRAEKYRTIDYVEEQRMKRVLKSKKQVLNQYTKKIR